MDGLSKYDEILEYSKHIKDDLIKFRRDLHSYPEIGWMEIRTTYMIYKELIELDCRLILGKDVGDKETKMGLPSEEELKNAYDFALKNGVTKDFAEKVKDGNTGLIAVFENGEGPTLAMRFDIDALPLQESLSNEHYPSKNGFESKNHGVMHACGHDGHAAIGVGVAKVINKFKDDFKGTIKLIFQPAEEGVRGAKSIVEKGHLDHVEYFLASHITNNRGYEDYDLFPGSGGALATTKLDVEFFGKSSHAGGSPENGNNAILGAATSIMNLYSIPRHSKGVSRINVGLVNSGSGRNIIADYAKLLIETRGKDTEINNYMKSYALNIVEGAAKMHNLKYKISVEGEANSFESDMEIIKIIGEVASQLNFKPTPKARMELGGSEDVSYMIERVQENHGFASFIRILTNTAGEVHNSLFDFDEEVLFKGVSIFSSLAYKIGQVEKLNEMAT